MTINEVVFIDSLPKLDLHGFDRDSARVAINDFISTENPEIMDIKFSVSIGVFSEEQIYCFSALIVYR